MATLVKSQSLKHFNETCLVVEGTEAVAIRIHAALAFFEETQDFPILCSG